MFSSYTVEGKHVYTGVGDMSCSHRALQTLDGKYVYTEGGYNSYSIEGKHVYTRGISYTIYVFSDTHVHQDKCETTRCEGKKETAGYEGKHHTPCCEDN